MDPIIVGVADCVVVSDPGQVLATYALGSCIGLALHDPASGLGGILHFMLPDSALDPSRARERPFMFADTGIRIFVAELCARGASPRRLAAHAAGGARIMDQNGEFAIGERNCLALRRILWKQGILLRGVAIGGAQSRTMRLEIGSGRVWIDEAGVRHELTGAAWGKGTVYGVSPADRR